MLDDVTNLEIDDKFDKIDVGPPLIDLSPEAIADLSADQAYGYMIVSAIRSGVVPDKLRYLGIGPVCRSRWLTTANRLCRMWISKHGLQGKEMEALMKIVKFVVGCYYPCWFSIKVKQSWIEGPRQILFQLEALRSQDKDVIEIVLPVVKRSAYFAQSELVIQTLLCSGHEIERRTAVNKIMEIRGPGDEESQTGDSSIRKRVIPDINADANSLVDLIDWTGMTEPTLTTRLTTSEIRQFLNRPMAVPNWPSHTQGVERTVQMVTHASAQVYSHERREQYIRGMVLSRQIFGRNRSKQDLARMLCTGTEI